jgi:hypothetical protein
VHTCSRCGYSGGQQDFADDAAVNPVVKEHVWDELAPKLPSGSLTGSDKYEFAAKVAIWQGAPPRRVADLFLRAAWCCVDKEDVEAERYFRRYAAWGFEDALVAGHHARGPTGADVSRRRAVSAGSATSSSRESGSTGS